MIIADVSVSAESCMYMLSADVYISVIIMVAVTTIITHMPAWLKMAYRKHLPEPATTVVEKEM